MDSENCSGFNGSFNGEEHCHGFSGIVIELRMRIKSQISQGCKSLQICRKVDRNCRLGGVLTCYLDIAWSLTGFNGRRNGEEHLPGF